MTKQALSAGPPLPLSVKELELFEEVGRPIPFPRAIATVNQIAQLTKERDQLKQQNQDLILTYKAQQFLEREIDDLRTHLDAKTGQCFELEAKCAAMRQRLEEILEVSELIDDETGHQTKATEKVLSDQCGDGWLSPEQKKVLVEAGDMMLNQFPVHAWQDAGQMVAVDAWKKAKKALEACKI